ncbi:MAG: hypothetical protein L6Q38_15395, partial [Nitrospira sp.]|nr:hypothetical protein [Nitrospira sp.]
VIAHGFSPDGRWIITSGHDRCVRVRDRLTGAAVCPPLVHPDEVFNFEMGSGKAWLATVCRTGSFHVWDLRSGTPLLPAWSPGERLSGLRLALGNHHAILFGSSPKIWIRQLPAEARPAPWSLEETTLLAELTSGYSVETFPDEAIPSDGWLARMKRFATLRPDYLAP